jgi:hypothetical protein
VLANPTITSTYSVAGLDSFGCAASGSETVTVAASPSQPTFYQLGDTLISSSQYNNQWFENGLPLKDDTSKYLIITNSTTDTFQVNVTNVGNGCSTTSNSQATTSIQQVAGISSQLSVYPNPFSNSIYVIINSSVQDVKDWNLQVSDVLGRTVFRKLPLNYSNDIDLSNLASGMYFITVMNKTGRSVVPVVKQN